MRKIRLCLLLSTLMAVPLALPGAPAAPMGCGVVPVECEAWTATYDGGGQDIYGEIVASPDGTRVFVASIQDTPEGRRQAALHAYDAGTGARLWNTTYADEGGPEPRRIVASPDGSRVHVVGTGYVSRLAQAFLATFDARTGELRWEDHWPLDSVGTDVWTDGSTVYGVGSIDNDYAAVAYDARTGRQVWTSTYDAHGGFNPGWRWWSYDVAFDVAHNAGSLYLTGVSAAPDGLLEYATVAIDAATGTLRWASRSHGYDAASNPVPSEAYDVAVSPEGAQVFVLGTDGLKTLDAETGEVIWSDPEGVVRCRPYWPMFHDECQLEVNPNGTRVFAFSHNDLVAYDAWTGASSWHRVMRWGDDYYGLARAMVLSPDGQRVYVASPGGREEYVTDTFSSIEWVYETRAFDAWEGSLVWRVTYGRACCAVRGIDVSPDGDRVFVTGEIHPRTRRPDILTVAYDTNLGLETLPPLPI